ncbi:unnamed protein product, partial [Thlaspi arvense]
NIFLAGIDTGAITMIWAMTELVKNPKLMKKVQSEIRNCLGDNKERITEEDVDKVPFLKMVIKETFRLHPAAPLILPRETMAHIKVQGYDIPPKRRILVNAWAIGRDPKLWTNPEEFDPERFVDSPVDYRGQHYELLPFGSGRRICPGMPMGIATVELGLLNLLYFFDWRFPDGMTERDIDMEEAGTLTIVKKVALKLVPNIFIAGIDTGAITMIWAMTELARNPELMKKLQGQIRERLGNNKERITEEDIGKVHYLNLVIKETFRLHPPVPLLLPRETMAHIKVQGYDIPPQRRILINTWAISRDPKLWTDPEVFNPERFVDSPVDYRGQHFELLAFGSGRRMCPGMAMGIVTVELGLLNLLYFFDWKLPDGMTQRDIDIEEAGALTVVKKVPLKLVPVRVH